MGKDFVTTDRPEKLRPLSHLNNTELTRAADSYIRSSPLNRADVTDLVAELRFRQYDDMAEAVAASAANRK